MDVVEEGGHAIKANCAKELFVMDPAVGLLELGVSFGGDVSEFMIDRHCFFFKIRIFGGFMVCPKKVTIYISNIRALRIRL